MPVTISLTLYISLQLLSQLSEANHLCISYNCVVGKKQPWEDNAKHQANCENHFKTSKFQAYSMTIQSFKMMHFYCTGTEVLWEF